MTKATANGTFPHNARAAAELYLNRGLAPIPLPPRSKNPGYEYWERLKLTIDVLDAHFPNRVARNVGILNGAPSGNTVDVDLDADEARVVGPLLLPQTGWIFGRASAPRSHWIYVVDMDLPTAKDPYEDLDSTTLLELRGTGGLTIYPPSTHKETGETIAWHMFTEPAQVPLSDLRQAVRQVAAAALLARHWPAKGSRDAAAMALAGGLVRAGWNEDGACTFIEAVATAAHDEEAYARAKKAIPAARKLEEGKNVTGWPTLTKLLGEKGDAVLRKVRDWLGLLVNCAGKRGPFAGAITVAGAAW